MTSRMTVPPERTATMSLVIETSPAALITLAVTRMAAS